MAQHNREQHDRDRDTQRQSDFDYDRSRSGREQERAEWAREGGYRGQEPGGYGQGERGRQSWGPQGGGYQPMSRGEWEREQGRGGWEREGRGAESQAWGEQGYGQSRGWQREGRGGEQGREYGSMADMPRGEFDYAAGGQGFPRSGREYGSEMGWQRGGQFPGQTGQRGGTQFGGSQFGGGQYGGSPFGGSRYPGAGRGEEMGRGPHTGRGPKGYKRSDDRIREDVCERLSEHPYLDASEIEVKLQGGEVTLAGTIEDRHAKRLAEDVAEQVSGVTEVHNQLRLREQQGGQGRPQGSGGQSGRSGGKE